MWNIFQVIYLPKSEKITDFNKLAYILQPYNVSPEMKRIKLKIKVHFGKEVHISIMIIVYTLNNVYGHHLSNDCTYLPT